MPVLPSYRNQLIDMTGFYMRATLAFNRLRTENSQRYLNLEIYFKSLLTFDLRFYVSNGKIPQGHMEWRNGLTVANDLLLP